MKRIAFISLNDHIPWGGSEVFWSELASKLIDSKKYDVGISPKYWEIAPSAISSLLALGARDYRRKDVSRKSSVGSRIRRKIFRSDSVKSSDKILFDFKPDLAFISLGNHNSGTDWMDKCRRHSIPYVLIVQLVRDASCPDENSLFYKSLREGYLHASKILCPSYDNKALLETQFGTALDNVEIINNPVQLHRHVPCYPENEIAQVGIVASLNFNHKGQDILLDTIRSAKWQGRKIHFNLYGSGPHEQVLRNLVNMWEIRNVTFHGHTSLEDIWLKNQILLMPSRMEGLSLAFLEALSLERPAIVTKVGDTARFIQDNVNGFLIKAPQSDFLDEALERAWQHRDAWPEMGKKARTALLNEIQTDPVEKFANQIDELIK